MSGTLMLHCGAFSATRQEVEAVETPRPTDTYTPLPYGQLLNWIEEAAIAAGLTPTEDGLKMGMTKNGSRLFFLMNFQQEYEGHSFSIGGRTSHDKSLAAGIVAGARNFICDNLSLSGDVTLVQRHDGAVDFEDMIATAVAAAPVKMEVLVQRIEALKEQEIRSAEAAHSFIFKAAMNNIVPWKRAEAIYREYQNPSHAEFAATQSKYRMLQAFTEVEKTSTNAETSMAAYLKYAKLFDLR
jgi:hypothetical protein